MSDRTPLGIELVRSFPATRERVFEFFADSALLAKWWGPRGFSIPSIDFAPRVGGAYRIAMQPPDGDVFWLTGTFADVDVPSSLAFSFEWEPPDPDDAETVARLAFKAIDGSTRVELRQGEFNTEARSALHRDGWAESFDKLAELVNEQR